MDNDEFKSMIDGLAETGIKVVCVARDRTRFEAMSDTYTVGLFSHPQIGAELLFTKWFDSTDAAKISTHLAKRAEDYPEFPISAPTEIDMGEWTLRFDPILAPEDGPDPRYPEHMCEAASRFYGRHVPLLHVTKI